MAITAAQWANIFKQAKEIDRVTAQMAARAANSGTTTTPKTTPTTAQRGASNPNYSTNRNSWEGIKRPQPVQVNFDRVQLPAYDRTKAPAQNIFSGPTALKEQAMGNLTGKYFGNDPLEGMRENVRLSMLNVDSAAKHKSEYEQERQKIRQQLDAAKYVRGVVSPVGMPGKEDREQLLARDAELEKKIGYLDSEISKANAIKEQTAAYENAQRHLRFDEETAKHQKAAMENQIAHVSERIGALQDAVNAGMYNSIGMSREEALTEINRLSELSDKRRNELAQLQQTIYQAEQMKAAQQYYSLMDNGDFDYYAAQGAAIVERDNHANSDLYLQTAKMSDPNPGMVGTEQDIRLAAAQNLGDKDRRGLEIGVPERYRYMTKDEVNIYCYLLAKEGRASAQEYLNTLEETLNARYGAQQAANIQNIDSDFIRNMAIGGNAAVSTVDNVVRGIARRVSDEPIANSAVQYARQDIYSELPPAGKLAVDVVSGVAGMVPSVLVGSLFGPAAGAAVIGLSASGNAYNQALSQGYSKEQARAYGNLVGASEGALQYLLGGIGKLGGMSGKIAKAVSRIDDALLRMAAQTGLEGLSEASEGYLQNILEPIYRNLIFGENNNIDLLSDEALYSALLEGLSAVVMNAPANVANFAEAVNERTNQQKIEAAIADIMQNNPQSQQTTDPQVQMDKVMQDVMGKSKTAPVVETGADGKANLPKISMADFTDRQSAVFNNVAYEDTDTQTAIMQKTHDDMVSIGAVVRVPESTLSKTEAYYPNLRGMKRKDRSAALKEGFSELKAELRSFLKGLKNVGYEFEVNGNILEAKLYETGVKEVMKNVTQAKANMLQHSPEIFQNAQYLYSTPSYDGDPDIYRWNYFYTPVQIGDDVVGVRIAVRDMAKTRDSQIYHWGIKNNAVLGGGGGGKSASHTDASSTASTTHIPQPEQSVNRENVEAAGAAQQQKNQTTAQQDRVDAMMRDDMGAKAGDSSETATARVLTEEPPTGKKKISAWNLFKDNVVDKGTVFETLSLKTGNRELQAKWKAIGRAENSAQWFMEHGSAGTNSLKSIRETVEKSGKTQAFYDYLYHLHNADRMNLEDRYADTKNKPVFGDSVTSEMSIEEAAKLEKANPEFKQWASEVYSYMDSLRSMMVEGGVISQKTADLWKEMYPHYVPIRRKGDDGLSVDVALDTKRTGVNAPIKRATGGSRNILPLFNTMAARTEQTFKAVAKNRFGVELKNLLGTTVEKTPVGVDEAIDSAESETLTEGKDGKNPTFTVFENGEKVTFEITEEMYDTMKPKGKFNSYTSKALNKANNIRRGLLTEYNPAFMLTNPIKDVQDVLINSQHPARTYAAMPKAIAELAGKKGQYYREYMEHGGEQNTYFDGEVKTFSKEKSGLSKVIGFPLEKISQANQFIERVPRMAEYIASREMGRSVDVAMLDAARVTTDFSAGGDFVKTLNRNGFTFLNASVQGAVQQVRNFREAKAEGIKGWAKLAAKFAVAGLSSSLLNHLLWDDDEDYEALPDYVKQNYYIVAKYGDGEFVRIPKGRTVAVIQEGFRQMENLITGNDEADFNAFAELVVSNLAPSNPLENRLLAPVSQALNNKAWHGGDIVPERLQDLPAAEQYDESTDELSRWLGEKLNISPYKVNYVLDQYSGAIGDVTLPTLTPEAERGNNSWWGNAVAPITDKFTTDSVMNNQNVSDFYSKKEELAKKANSSKATKEDDVRSKYMNNVNTELAKLYKEQREIQNGELPDAEKYEAVRDVQKQIVALTKEALNSYDSIRMDRDYRPTGATKDLIVKAMDSVGGYGDKATEQNYRKLIYSPSTIANSGDVLDKAFEYAVQYNDAIAKEDMGYPVETEWMVEARSIKSVRDRVDYFIGKAAESLAKKAGDGKYDGLSNLLDDGTIDTKTAISMLPTDIHDRYMNHKSYVPVDDLMDALAYKNKNDATSEDMKEYLKRKYPGSANRKKRTGLWETIYKSKSPW